MAPESKENESTGDLVSEALSETRSLLKVEVELARDELRQDLAAFKVTALSILLAVQVATMGLTMLVVAAVLGLSSHPALGALIAGMVLILGAGGMGAAGYLKRPHLMHETKDRLLGDLKILKEGHS